MSKIKFLFVGCLLAVLASCGHSDYKKTSTGMVYDIIKDGKGETIKHGQFIKLNLKVTLNDDSVLQNTFDNMPVYGPADTSNLKQHNFTDILPMLRAGDSAVTVQFIDTLKRLGQIPPGDTTFKAGATIKTYVKIIKIFKNEAEVQADYMAEQDKERQREIASLKKYLDDKKISVQQSPKGVFVQTTTAGTGPQVDSGKLVSVLYVGKTQAGKVFDSSRNGQPIQFVINSGQVIPGWDEGLKMMKQGAKGVLYIPSMLAYGSRPPSPDIKPFDNLFFNVEVVGVQDAPPPAAAAPQMPGMQPPPGQAPNGR
jgi:FKBP-type peptidyl-prolyl cis-trans isomerase FkpA